MQKQVWMVLLSALLTAVCAFGDSTQWVIAPSGGTYSYAGGSASLTGSNIAIENVEGVGTPDDSGTLGTLDIVDGLMSFTSGAATGTWAWGQPGTLTITGCVAGVTTTDTTCTAADDTAVLVSDEFTSVEITGVGGGLGFEFGELQGTINAAIAAYFGVPVGFTSPASNASDVVNGLPSTAGSAFSTVTPGTPGGTLNLVSSVPEEWRISSTLGIFAFGIAVFGVARRRGLIKTVAS